MEQPKLCDRSCVPCEGGVLPLTREEIAPLAAETPAWTLSADALSIARDWRFKDFKEALAFVNRVGEVAESEGHHPDIHLTGWRNVRLELSTHAIKGLSENDFILAAKIDRL